MARKVFISVLGTGLYEKGFYVSGDFRSSETTFIQQATIEFLHCNEWPADSKAFFLLTDKARKDNWDVPDGKRTKQPEKIEVEYTGLHDIIQTMNLPFSIEDISIPDGNNEQEMWDIFSAVYERLEEGDELYFDLTHSFRYLPMLMLVLGNYAKFLKHTTICSITYGNWEARNKPTREAPINDLLPLSSLFDWTNATAEYLNYGFADNLHNLSYGQLRPLLQNRETFTADAQNLRRLVDNMKEISQEMRFCRGVEITKADTLRKLTNSFKQIQEVVVPLLRPVVGKIADSFSIFSIEKNSANMFHAARWCFDHQLHQQATTFLEEGVISFFCERHSMDITDIDSRDLINFAVTVVRKKIPEEQWSIIPERKSLFQEILKDELLQDNTFVNSYSALIDLRNLYNHCGMKKDIKNIKYIREGVEKAIQAFSPLFLHSTSSNLSARKQVFINLTNHPSEGWEAAQLQAARQYGVIIDMEFPSVGSEMGYEEVNQLAKKYVEQIASQAHDREVTVHVMGEMTFTFAVVSRLKEMGIPCVASTTERIVEEAAGKRTYTFRFARFREY